MIVYVGNMLSRHGRSVNFIESLSIKLKPYYRISAASDKRNKLTRFLEMLLIVWQNKRKCKVTLIDTYSTTAFIYAYWTARLCKVMAIPYIPILHGGNLPLKYQTDKMGLGWFLKNADAIVSPSIYLHDFFSKHGYAVKYIPNFIEIGNYPFLQRSVIKPNLLWVRSFQEIYNPLLAIRILKDLKQKGISARLCMVGGGKETIIEDANKSIRAFRLEQDIIVTGALPKKEWINLSVNYDIFINTTNVDNMPVSVIEAMALGLLVISTDVGGIPYLIEHEHTGLLVSQDKSEEFLQSIQRLLKDPVLVNKMQMNARRKVETFDWENVKNMWFDLLNPYLQ